MEEVCRACLKRNGQMLNIFDGSETSGISIADMISECTGFPVQRGDLLPEVICPPCLQDAQNSFDIKQTYERSYQLFCKMKKASTTEQILEEEHTIDRGDQVKQEDIEEEFLDEDNGLPRISNSKELNFWEKPDNYHALLRSEDFQNLQKKDLVETSHCKRQKSNIVEEHNHFDDQVRKQAIEKEFVNKILCQVKRETNEEEFLEIDEGLSQSSDSENQRLTGYDNQDLEKPHLSRGKAEQHLERIKESISDNVHVRTDPIYNGYSEEDITDDRFTYQANTEKSKISRRRAPSSPFKCSYCPKTCTYLSKFRIHLQTHTKERPNHCPYCPKTFASLYNLNQHLRTHNGGLFECPHCFKRYPHKSTLKIHIQTHNKGTRKYKCLYCSKSFSILENLELHNLMHTGEQPKKCPHCPKAFSRNSVLTKHFLTHRQESPHQCSFCQLYFENGKYLSNHIRTHTGKRPFQLVLSKDRQS
ncbi:zinc finger protein 266-like [Drosophila elegans]|uniref:zinc finger protein 266-like n=1 Tax=Drosophila elegans TaxID=30023 RepID=UPI0007E7B004|nr:zinc finger protein 266-like [Drosophila elegans]